MKAFESLFFNLNFVVKNIIKRRVADPICMATKSLNEALCECIEEKISGAEAPPPAGPQEQQENEKNGSTEEEPICVWQMLSDRQGISILRFANMYQCKNLFITQGYNAHDGDVYDVFVVEQPNNTVNTFIMKGIAKAINFSKLEIENDRSYIYTVLFNGLYFFKNWDKFW